VEVEEEDPDDAAEDPEEDPDDEPEEVPEEEPEPEEELEPEEDEPDDAVLLLPEETAEELSPGARFAGAFLAAKAKFARLRVAFAAVFSFMTATIPAWQCLACEQYSHIGVALLIGMVYVGLMASFAETAIKPEKMPVTLGVMFETG